MYQKPALFDQHIFVVSGAIVGFSLITLAALVPIISRIRQNRNKKSMEKSWKERVAQLELEMDQAQKHANKQKAYKKKKKVTFRDFPLEDPTLDYTIEERYVEEDSTQRQSSAEISNPAGAISRSPFEYVSSVRECFTIPVHETRIC
ncbi:hypothetical protein Q1695_009635 [Nippostrongylus brasiliensis]|nr:hypothetical protein Q1695_009635 [Nippostrongylus brasiliensis]